MGQNLLLSETASGRGFGLRTSQNCPLWVSTDRSLDYHPDGWFRPEAAAQFANLLKLG